MLTLENLDTQVHQMGHNTANNHDGKTEMQFDDPEALTAAFKAMLLEVLARRKKENLREGNILTVAHPDMNPDEEVPFLAERAPVPSITIRRCTGQDREDMHALKKIFPVLLDAHNAIGSSFARSSDVGLFG